MIDLCSNSLYKVTFFNFVFWEFVHTRFYSREQKDSNSAKQNKKKKNLNKHPQKNSSENLRTRIQRVWEEYWHQKTYEKNKQILQYFSLKTELQSHRIHMLFQNYYLFQSLSFLYDSNTVQGKFPLCQPGEKQRLRQEKSRDTIFVPIKNVVIPFPLVSISSLTKMSYESTSPSNILGRQSKFSMLNFSLV